MSRLQAVKGFKLELVVCISLYNSGYASSSADNVGALHHLVVSRGLAGIPPSRRRTIRLDILDVRVVLRLCRVLVGYHWSVLNVRRKLEPGDFVGLGGLRDSLMLVRQFAGFFQGC